MRTRGILLEGAAGGPATGRGFALNLDLRESEERYRTLFDLVPVAAYTCDSAGVIQNFNRRAAELWGREPAFGDTDERFCGSYKLFRPDGTYMPHAQCPMAQVVAGTLSEDAEVLIERPDGSRITVVVNIRPHINRVLASRRTNCETSSTCSRKSTRPRSGWRRGSASVSRSSRP